MADITITVTEIVDAVSVESSPSAITVTDGVFVDSGTGGGTGGAVDSVNGHTGTVVLGASDVGADASGAAAAAQAASQPLDSDLTAIAALSTTTFGRALLALADAASLRTTAGLGTAATSASTAFDAAGAAASAQAASQPLDSDLTAIAALSTTTFGRSLLAQADAAAARTTLGAGTSSLAIGTTSTTAAAGNDSRLSDARTPTAHASSHASGGSDAVTIAESQVTGLVSDLAGKAASSHTHAESDVTNLVSDLAAKAPLASPALTGNPTAPTATAGDNDTSIATTAFVTNAVAKQPEVFMVAVSDETTAITTGTAKVTFRMPFAMTLTSVRSSLTTASSSGLPTVNIKESGTTIFSTNLSIDASEKTSTTAATAAVLSDTSLADDAEMTIDITVAGTGATGLKVYFIGTRT